MTSPLSRPPIDLPPGPVREAPPPRASTVPPPPQRGGPFARVADELRTLSGQFDPARSFWNASRHVLPAFTLPRTRARLLAMMGADIRRGVGVLGHVDLVGPSGSARNLRVGSGTLIAPNVTFCLDARITIGKNVSIGPSAMLYTSTHSLGGSERRMHYDVMAQPIVVEDGVWVGLGAIILSGVRLGRGSVVAAGAVVNRDVPENVLVAGNPAQIVEELPVR